MNDELEKLVNHPLWCTPAGAVFLPDGHGRVFVQTKTSRARPGPGDIVQLSGPTVRSKPAYRALKLNFGHPATQGCLLRKMQFLLGDWYACTRLPHQHFWSVVDTEMNQPLLTRTRMEEALAAGILHGWK